MKVAKSRNAIHHYGAFACSGGTNEGSRWPVRKANAATGFGDKNFPRDPKAAHENSQNVEGANRAKPNLEFHAPRRGAKYYRRVISGGCAREAGFPTGYRHSSLRDENTILAGARILHVMPHRAFR